MAMSLPELRDQLSDIEPTEGTYEGIGASEVDLLRKLLHEPEPWVAARAVHALSRIDAESAHAALLDASQSSRPEVRTAVAASAGALAPEVSDELLSRLLSDPDIGVRKFAIKSASDRSGTPIRERVAEIANTEVYTALRQIAEERSRWLSSQ